MQERDSEDADPQEAAQAPREPAAEAAPNAESQAETDAEDPAHTDKPRPENKQDKQNGQDTSERPGIAVINAFFSEVIANGSTFGAGLGEGDGAARGLAMAAAQRPVTGSVSVPEIAEALDHYVAPACYDEALHALRSEGVVVLAGPEGTGKRAAAISLLRDSTGEGLWALSPTATLETLASRTYNRGAGYVVLDHFEPGPRGQGGGGRQARVAAFDWQRVSGQVREAGAYLVVTTTAVRDAGTGAGAVRTVRWEPPHPERVLRARLGASVDEAVLVQAVEAVPEVWTMTDLVRFAKDVLAVAGSAGGVGDGAVEAMAGEAFRVAARRQVAAWFDGEPTRREVVEITVLAFVLGVGEREFEAYAAGFERVLEGHVPVPPPHPAGSAPGSAPVQAGAATGTAVEPAPAAEPFQPAADALPQRRSGRITPGGLLKLQRHSGGGTPRRFLAFKNPVQHRFVLAELWDRFDGAFWDAAGEWLDEVAGDPGTHVVVAKGLALLSFESFDEVETGYLARWADGGRLPLHQETAVLTLWFMCLDETLAPVALGAATSWVGYGTPRQRRAGALAFSGQLGVRYPDEALRRLWQLIVQDTDLSPEATAAMAQLFATLASHGEGAGKVLLLLDAKVRGLAPTGADRRRYKLALAAAVQVLSVRAPQTGVPSIAIFLAERPDRLPAAAAVWAAALRHRPCRHDALLALWEVLGALERRARHSYGTPGGTAPDGTFQRPASAGPASDIAVVRALGGALAERLPPHERELLRKDLGHIALSARNRRTRSKVLTEVLLAALDRAEPRTDQTESGEPA
ncbi:hypothetical protein [Actinomadura xylanilytica]|uniref:hypothetical protein n=1 Tax=Actinomadura xylanilytica TaxID=887459 RepID=UPI00255AF952|nr:hypothetical protein [Actinomadura xylanilytica]MDL4772811.1 hypothetical protein [Actinomadura xylanilytica]